MEEEIVRYLIEVSLFLKLEDGNLFELSRLDYETNGQNLFSIPPVKYFSRDVEFKFEFKLKSIRYYKNNNNNILTLLREVNT